MNLLLIKHSLPEILPDVPPARWHLNAEGRQRAEWLASALEEYAPERFISSPEPKALETAQIVASRLGYPHAVQVDPDLHEHLRPQPGLLSRPEFEATIKGMFAQPKAVVYGAESGEQALRRFEQAVQTALNEWLSQKTLDEPDRIGPDWGGPNLAIVAHGTVISLYVAAACGVEPFPLWQRLDTPSFVVLGVTGQVSQPDLSLRRVVHQIPPPLGSMFA